MLVYSFLIVANPGFTTNVFLDNEQIPSGNSNLILNNRQAFSYKILDDTNKGFGYDIYQNGKLLIHQPVIPGRPGNKGFLKSTDARKVAKLVIEKLKKGTMPPTITEIDLRRLGI